MSLRRLQQGELIAQKGSIKRFDDRNYVVSSQSGSGSYNIQLTDLGFVCSCADHLYRGVKCKHIHAVEFSWDNYCPTNWLSFLACAIRSAFYIHTTLNPSWNP